MIALLQRVSTAEVEVGGRLVAKIGRGLCVFIGIEKTDGLDYIKRMAERLLNYRVFADERGHMNLSVVDVGGELLLVPNFTLAADTKKGMRPSFTPAAEPAEAKRLFELLLHEMRGHYTRVQHGSFGVHMRVALTNDGPVTLWLKA